MPNVPHKHAAVIKAWADGAEIELYSTISGQWLKCLQPTWELDSEYRVKPVPPHPDQELIDALRKGETGIEVKWPSNKYWLEIPNPKEWWRFTVDEVNLETRFRRRHKWQKEMDAWRAGKTIQFQVIEDDERLDGTQYEGSLGVWYDFAGLSASFNQPSLIWRIKPERVKVSGYMMFNESGVNFYPHRATKNLKLLFEDGVLVDAQVIKS